MVGAPPGAALYCICGVNEPAVLVRTMPLMTTVIFSVAVVDAAVTTVAVAAVAYILLTVPSALPVVDVVSAVYAMLVNVPPNANSVLNV